MKKLLKVVLGLGVLVVAAMAILPFVIDVDKYRPQIIEAAKPYLNGELKIGKLQLSLWGRILVRVDGLEVKDAAGKSVVSVKDAAFHLPFASVFSGAPELRFEMNRPELSVHRTKDGKMNVLSLVRTQPAAAPTAGAPSAKLKLPAILLAARLGVVLKDANLAFLDDGMKLTNKIEGLNLVVRDLSLSRKMSLELWADLNVVMAGVLKVAGPIRVNGTMTPELAGGDLKQISISMTGNFSDLDVQSGSLFHKAKGIPMTLSLKANSNLSALTVDQAAVKFHNVDLSAKASVTDLGNSNAVNFSMTSNEIGLAAWSPLVPMLKEFELGGTAKLSAQAQGPSAQLQYGADLEVKDFSAKAPYLKGKPVIQAVIQVKTDRIEKIFAQIKAPGSDLSVNGRLDSFSAPRFQFKIGSTGIDLDQLIDFPKKSEGAAPTAAPEQKTAQSGGGSASGGAGDLDAMLDPLRKNAMARNSGGTIDLSIPKLKMAGLTVSNVESRVSLRDLVVQLESFKLAILKGSVTTKAAMDLKPAHPTYRFDAAVKNLDANDALSQTFPIFKRTLYGTFDLVAQGNGSSFNVEPAIKNFNLGGNLKAQDAVFQTIDIAQMTSKALKEAIDRVGEKVPQLKGKSLPGLPDRRFKYKLVQTDFKMKDGVFSAPNFTGKSYPNEAVDIQGATTLNVVDYGLDAKWTIVDTYNTTKARDLFIEVEGTRVDHLLARGNDPVSFPVTVGCKAMAPCYSYTEVPAHFVGIALANIADAAKARLANEAKAKANQAIQNAVQKAPEPVQNVIKKIGGGLFGG